MDEDKKFKFCVNNAESLTFTREMVFRCDLCEQAFDDEEGITEHLRENHIMFVVREMNEK